MTTIVESVDELIGNTPLLNMRAIERDNNLDATILAKLEYFNPTGSVKDRAARAIIDAAEQDGSLQPGGTIIEATSGNTGIGLSSVGTSRGYRVVIVMPDSMSVERQRLMKAYGAELVLTPGAEGMKGAIAKMNELHEQIDNSVIAGQFDNPANVQAHYTTTGPEIWNDTDGHVDYFVSGVGTGGTLTGTARYLKEQNPDIKVVAVEPANSPVLSEGHAGKHAIQGIGAGFVPSILDRSLIDEVITVPDEDALETGRMIGREEGILVGISSGAAMWAAIQIAKRPEAAGKNIVVILPDSGDRYLSTALFAEE